MVWVFIFMLLAIPLAYFWVKLVNGVLNPLIKKTSKAKQPTPQNPYIEAHLLKMSNDKLYEQYLNWMHENNVIDVPFEKWKTMEERQFESSLNDLLNG
jgi:hypothetical protein